MNRRGFLKGLAAAVASVAVLRQLPETKPESIAPTDDGWDVAFSDTSGGRFSMEKLEKAKMAIWNHRPEPRPQWPPMSRKAREELILKQLTYQASHAMRAGCNMMERDLRAAGLL